MRWEEIAKGEYRKRKEINKKTQKGQERTCGLLVFNDSEGMWSEMRKKELEIRKTEDQDE